MTDPADPPAPHPPPAADPFPSEPQLRLDPGGHTAMINRTAVDASGRWLVSGSDDKTVRVWRLLGSPESAPAGTPERTLRIPLGPGNLGKVYAIALSPDGETVAVGGWTGSASGTGTDIYLFDRATGALHRRLGGLPNVVLHLAFDRTGLRLAAVLGGGEGLRRYGLAPGPDGGTGGGPRWGEIDRDPDYGDDCYGADFAADGRLATACRDGQVRLYAPAATDTNPWPERDGAPARTGAGRTLKPERSARPPGGQRPYSVAFSPDGSRIAVGFEDSTAVDLLDGHTLAPLGGSDTAGIDNGTLSTVAWSADGSRLQAAGRYAEGGRFPVLGWSGAGRGPRLAALRAATDTVMTLHPLSDGALAVGAQNGIVVFDPPAPGRDPSRRWSSPKVAADFRGQRHAQGIRLSPGGDRVAFGYAPWGERPALFDLCARALTLDPSPETLAGLALPDEGPAPPGRPRTAADPRPVLADWVNGTEPKLNGRPLKLQPYERARSLALVPPGAPEGLSCCLGTEWWLRAYAADGAERWQQPVPGTVWALNVTRDGRYAVAGYGDGTLRWHRLADGAEVLACYPCPDAPGAAPGGTQPRWVLWTPLGQYAASPGGEDLIGWHLNRGPDRAPDFFPASRLRETFNRPDVIARVLECADPAAALRLADAARGEPPATGAGSGLGPAPGPAPESAPATKGGQAASLPVLALLPPVIAIQSPRTEVRLDGRRLSVLYDARSDAGAVLEVEARLDGVRVAPLERTRLSASPDGTREIGQLTLAVPPQERRGGLQLVHRARGVIGGRARTGWGLRRRTAGGDRRGTGGLSRTGVRHRRRA